MLNNRGERMPPCGTPALIFAKPEKDVPTLT